MNKQTLLNKLDRRDLPGVGCVVYYTDGCKGYNFYEDFSDSNGIDRAAKDFSDLIDKGRVRCVEYIHKDGTTIHFFDWNTKPGTFCVSDEMRLFCKCHNLKHFRRYDSPRAIINGLEYKLDYTPAIDGIAAITATLANK